MAQRRTDIFSVVLASLLPGIRDLRAPLAAGYLWLLDLWLVLNHRIPSSTEATGPLEALYRLHGVVSAVGTGIALSFAAYLVGVLSEGLSTAALRRYPSRVSIPGARALHGFVYEKIRLLEHDATRAGAALEYHPLYKEMKRHLGLEETGDDETVSLRDVKNISWAKIYSASPLREGLGVRRLGRSSDDSCSVRQLVLNQLIDDTALRVTDEFDLIALRLVGREPDLFSQYDRLRSEGEFRVAIVPPLAALITVIAFQTSMLWLGCLLVLLLFLVQGTSSYHRGAALLVDALVIGRVKAPSIEVIEGYATGWPESND
jgi:hypothetical protein